MAKLRNNRPVEGKRLSPLLLVATVRPWEEITDRAHEVRTTFATTTAVAAFFGVVLSFSAAWWWILVAMLAGPSFGYVIAGNDLHEIRNTGFKDRMISDRIQSQPRQIHVGAVAAKDLRPGDRILKNRVVKDLQQRRPGTSVQTTPANSIDPYVKQLVDDLDYLVMAIKPCEKDVGQLTIARLKGGPEEYNTGQPFYRLRSSPLGSKDKGHDLAAALADLMEIMTAESKTTDISENINSWRHSREATDHALRTALAARLAEPVGTAPRLQYASIIRGSFEPLLTAEMIRNGRFRPTELGKVWASADHRGRRRDARNAVVRWLAEPNSTRQGPKTIQGFPHENRASAQGRFLSNNDLIGAVRYLEKEGLVESAESEPPGNSSLRLTKSGEFYIEQWDDGDVTEYVKHNRGPQINVNTFTGNLAAGDAARQSFTIHGDINVSGVVETLDSAIRELLPSLDPKDREIAERTFDEIATESRKQDPDRDRLGKLLRTLRSCLASSTMTALSGVVAELIKSLLVKLGVPPMG